MSRTLVVVFIFAALPAANAQAQQVYGPSEGFEGDEDTPLPIVEERPCESQPQEDGVILVCRELTDSERYRSPLPRPTQSDRAIIPGLTDPPCWVTNPGSPGCIRFGYAPEPAIMVDVSAFPERLSEDEAEQVFAGEAAEPVDQPAIGERVPIDLSEGD